MSRPLWKNPMLLSCCALLFQRYAQPKAEKGRDNPKAEKGNFVPKPKKETSSQSRKRKECEVLRVGICQRYGMIAYPGRHKEANMIAGILLMSQVASIGCVVALISSSDWLHQLDNTSSGAITLFCILFSAVVIISWRLFSQDAAMKAHSMLPYFLSSLLSAEASLLHFVAYHLSPSTIFTHYHALIFIALLSLSNFFSTYRCVYVIALLLCITGIVSACVPHVTDELTSGANALAMYTALGYQSKLCALEGVPRVLSNACLTGTFTTITALQACLFHSLHFITLLSEHYTNFIFMVCSSALVTCVNGCIVSAYDKPLGALASIPAMTYFTLYQYITPTSTLALNNWYVIAAMCGVMLFVFGIVAALYYLSYSHCAVGGEMPPTPRSIYISDGDYEPLVAPSDTGTEAV